MIKYFYILLPIFFTFNLVGQDQDEKPKELVLERVNGFSASDRIEEILVTQDIVWFAGKKGTSSYNNSNSTLSHILTSPSAVAVELSYKGDVFSAFANNNIYMNDQLLYFIEEEGVVISDLEVYKTNLWVATNKGIYVFNTKTRKLTKIHTTKSSDMKSNNVTFIEYYKPLDRLWVGTDKGIKEVRDDKKWKTTNKGEHFIAVTQSIDGLWFLSNKELWLIYADGGKDRWQPQGLRNGLFEGKVNDLALDKEDNLYIASDILIRYNPYTDKLDKYGENIGLVASKCLSIASDEIGALWLGTADAGLFRIYEDEIKIDEMHITTLLTNPISCPGAMDGSLSVDVAGGTPPYKYYWERVRLKGDPKPTSLKAGTYKVTVEDMFGIRKNTSIKIDDPDKIVNNVISTEAVSIAGKRDGKAVITPVGGTPPYRILWDNGEKGSKAKKLNYGYNYVTITDSNDCHIVEAINIEKPKILPDLDIAKIRVGQTLQINKLYFESDSSAISDVSFEVLNEVYEFMSAHTNVVIEIGGHTNNIPPEEYCDKLSNSRAKTVAQFLYDRGIVNDRITFKGYGKRKPIASNETVAGRKKNQRVEIKILRLQGKDTP